MREEFVGAHAKPVKLLGGDKSLPAPPRCSPVGEGLVFLESLTHVLGLVLRNALSVSGVAYNKCELSHITQNAPARLGATGQTGAPACQNLASPMVTQQDYTGREILSVLAI